MSQYQCSSTESISFKNDESVSTLSNPQKPDLAEEKKSRLTQAQELHLAAAAFFVIPGQIYAGEVMSNCLAFICIMIQRFPPMGVVEGAYLIVVLCSKICKKEEKRKSASRCRYLSIWRFLGIILLRLPRLPWEEYSES